MASDKIHRLVLPEVYRDLSTVEMEYDGSGLFDFFGDLWGGLTDVVGGAVGGITNFFGDLWGGLTSFAGGLWGGLTSFAGGLWGGFMGFIGFGDDGYYAQQRNGWGPQSFYNDLGQFRAGISRYISSPMKYQ